jgi:Domain of unknown function (DUF4276)
VTTRIALLVECGRDGLESIVCRKMIQLLAVEHKVAIQADIIPMDNKARLIQECGTVCSTLLANGYERVIVLWDERPAWPKEGEALCWHNDREDILDRLKHTSVSNDHVHLVCIEREFESWLLFDHKLIACVLSSDEHPVKVPAQKKPDRMGRPKGTMISLFRELAGKRYVDVQFALRFAECLTTLSRIRKCRTFKRFEQSVTGQ